MYPLPEHHHLAAGRHLLAGEHMDVAEHEEIYLRMRLMVFPGEGPEAGEKLAVGYATVFTLHAAVAAPAISERHRPARMDARKKKLADLAAEKSAHKPEARLEPPYPVAMSHEECPAAYALGQASVYHLDAELRREVVEYPYVVVAYEPDYPHAAVAQIGKLAEETHEPTGHDIAVFIPVVEDVAQQIDRGRILLYAVEKCAYPQLRLPRIREIGSAHMEVAKEIRIPAFSSYILCHPET